MQSFCQWFLVVRIVVGFFMGIERSYLGRPAIQPKNSEGLLVTFLSTLITAAIIYGAGAFDRLVFWTK
jgi:hypothetical protein